jgi:subtilisin family serine protease
MAEQDQVIQLDDPKNLHSLASNTLPPDDWGPQMINAPAIWAQGYQGQGMTVAVVDTGTDITHPQLASNVFVNSGEVPNNKVDDDSNGYVDDVNGYDFNTNSGAVTDGNGHGTHVSGIIGANHTGAVQGVAPKAKILPAPFMDSTGSGQVSDAISAMQYAAKMKANVVNASWGGAPCSSQLQQEIVNLNSAGILFVSAAGNDGVNLDQSPEYPAAFAMSGQLTVAALFYNNASNPVTYMMDGYSNYSYNLVNLAAPGTNILSTWPGGGTQVLSGTSMATPFVSGAAAVLWSAKPSATLVEIRNAIVNGITKGDYAVISRGRLDLQKALATLLGQ